MNRLGIKAHELIDQPLIDSEVDRLLEKGWEERDVWYLMNSLEEVNPDMPEDRGCARIKSMYDKYKKEGR